MSRSHLALVLALGILTAAQARGQSPGPLLAQSSFLSGTDGWLNVTLPYPSAVPPTVLASSVPTWVPGLGGYVRMNDPDGSQQTGDCQYWSAPAAFLGAKSAAWGGSLQFDLANTGSGFGPFVQEDLILVGAGLTLVHALPGIPVGTFTHYAVPMSEQGWTVGGSGGPAATSQQMQSVLSALASLHLRAEHQLGPDIQFLDNVTLHGAPAGGPWTDLGFGLAGVAGIPTLVGTGTLAPASTGNLALANAKPASLAVLFISFASAPSPFKGGTLVPVPVVLSFSLATNGAGALTLPWIWPAGLPSGTSLYFQYAIQDAAASQGASLSNAEKGVTP
ncbi:MAG TPA: laminin B domain-containing protein [Planctomycetota bacterium]|nr:laminin B domain-containing protein [Planctomycetota bacterium]